MNKRSFILYHDYAPQFNRLSDEQCGKLIKGIFEYEITGEYPSLPKTADMAFGFIRNALDENRKQYEEVCKRRSEAGKNSGVVRREKNKTNKMNKCSFEGTKQPDTDTETVTDTDTVTDREREEKNAHTLSKKARGDFENVFLSDQEYQRLCKDYGNDVADEAIELLSTRMARDDNSRYKNENHFATIKDWVITAVNEERVKKQNLESQKTKSSAKKPTTPGFDFDFEDIYER